MRILIIKLAALGDVVQATGPMRRIRAAHPDARIDLLTTPPYAALAQALGVFDHIETDGRPRGALAHLRLARRLRRGRYDRVYDLQTSDRSSAYRLMFAPRFPEWSGIAAGASHPHANPQRDRMHTLERQAEQLQDAGIWPDAPTAPGTAPSPDLSALGDGIDPAAFGLAAPYALLVPGASPQRPGKRWPAEGYLALAAAVQRQGLATGVVGGPAEADLGREIAGVAGAVDLTGRTDFAQLAGLGARAALVVGNDTGPVHLLAATGAPTLALFSAESDPALCAPRGRRVAVLRADRLADLDPGTVIAKALTLLDRRDARPAS